MTQPSGFPSGFQCIGLEEAEQLIRNESPTILDVRDARSFMAGHIDGARTMSPANLAAFVANVPKDRPVLIYCYHGHSSQDYARYFTEAGFARTYSLDGGYEGWRNRPVASPAAAVDSALRVWLFEENFPGDDVNAVVANAMTPLMHASHRGEIEFARLLLAAGAQIEARNGDGNSALWLACVGKHLDMIDLLVDAGINLDNQNDNGATALMYAASSGRTEVVERLLARGADPAVETFDGFSALDMAANLDCLNFLRGKRAARA